jgi:hypothetical protein
VLALTVPIAGHAGGLGSVIGPAKAGPAPGIVLVWDGGGSDRHSGLSASVQRPVALTNGVTERVGLIGDRTVTMAGGARMAGQEFPTTISGFLGAQSSIIPSPTGEARQAGGVIRSRHRSRTCDPRKEEDPLQSLL